MKAITIENTCAPGLRVVIEELHRGRVIARNYIIRPTDLRSFVTQEQRTEIYCDNERVEFCHTPGCNNLVTYGTACALCPDCLLKYQTEQITYLNDDAKWLARFEAARIAADAAYEAQEQAGPKAQADAHFQVFQEVMGNAIPTKTTIRRGDLAMSKSEIQATEVWK